MESTALRCGEAIRQEPCEGRIGNTVERGDAAGARRNATRRAGVFCVHTLSLWTGSSKGLPVFPDTGRAFLLPTPQNPSGAVVQSGPNLLWSSDLPAEFNLYTPVSRISRSSRSRVVWTS